MQSRWIKPNPSNRPLTALLHSGVIGPDGQPIQVKSFVPSAPDNELVVVIDSGYTLPQVPRSMSDAIYGRVPGAVYDVTRGYWTVPCDSLVNLTFRFGGVEIPIHPLDVVMSEFSYKDANGNPACVGSVSVTAAYQINIYLTSLVSTNYICIQSTRRI